MIISRGGNTACSNTALLLPPNSLAQKKWKRQNICIPWVWWGNASWGDCSFPALTHHPFALSFCSRCWCATLGRGWCFWEGNSVSERRLARNRVLDLCCGKAWGDPCPRVVWGQFRAVTGIKAILPLCVSAAVYMGDGEDSGRAWAVLFETWCSWSFSTPQQLLNSLPEFGWILPIVKRQKHQNIHPQPLQLFGNPWSRQLDLPCSTVLDFLLLLP